MNRTTIAFVLTAIIALAGCAQPGNPTGGEKDKIPPKLLASSPLQQQTNYTNTEINLVFDEPVQSNTLQSKLIITPRTETAYEVDVRKGTVTLTFEEPLLPNTTYTFNFQDGITDVTEKNPWEDPVLAFSTGPIIDSLKLSGNVKTLLMNQAVKEATVAIYKEQDTSTIFNNAPDYFVKTDEQGNFGFTNLKAGSYKVYAFFDDNKNLKAESKSEPYGFLSKPVKLDTGFKDTLQLRIQRLDINELRLNSNRAQGKYYALRYNKPLKRYWMKNLSNKEKVWYSATEREQTLLIYNTLKNDTTLIEVAAFDSVGNKLRDTIKVAFGKSRRAGEDFTASVEPTVGSDILAAVDLTLLFSKPVKRIGFDSLFFQFDSVTQASVERKDVKWNVRRTELTVKKDLTTYKDSTANSSAQQQYKMALVARPSAFISIEDDTLKAVSIGYKWLDPDDYGTLKGELELEAPAFFVQLITKEGKVLQTLNNAKTYTFKQVPPGEYTVRILVDANKNGTWDTGNILKNKEPEPVYFISKYSSVRAGWIIEIEPERF